ncbi:hypothetical protein [Acetobacter nitrogenifigens]|nr:hypothetical protein [Acetobacter nitrogenifigens]
MKSFLILMLNLENLRTPCGAMPQLDHNSEHNQAIFFRVDA